MDPLFDPSDLHNEDYYCKHGTFIGNPFGADYLCGFCEQGYTDSEFQAHLNSLDRARFSRQILSDMFDLCYRQMPKEGPVFVGAWFHLPAAITR